MKEQDQRILNQIQQALGNERMAHAIVYLHRGLLPAGGRLRAGDVDFSVPWAAQIAFIDLEPEFNWGHACCYLAIRQDAEELLQVAARMPPFLKAGSPPFRFLWRGPLAPEWAVNHERD